MLRSRIPEIASHVDDAVGAALTIGAELIAEAAKERVPVQTGRLRDSIHVEHTSDDTRSVVVGDSDVFYGHMVEFGTTKTPAHPFLIPAAEANMEHIESSVRAALGKLDD